MPIFSKNFYAFFGLEPKLRLDLESLQKRFYELSRNWHPDRFTRKSAEEQSEALQATAILNDGYRTLRDPVKRAEYLLTEEGFPIGELEKLFAKYDVAETRSETAKQALQEIRGVLNRRRYIENLMRDVDRALNASKA